MLTALGVLCAFLLGRTTALPTMRPYLREGSQSVVVYEPRALQDGTTAYLKTTLIRCPLHQSYYEWTDGRPGVCR